MSTPYSLLLLLYAGLMPEVQGVLSEKQFIYYSRSTDGVQCNQGSANCEEMLGWIAYKTDLGNNAPGLLLFPGPWGDGGSFYEREVARTYANKGMVVFVPDYNVIPGNTSDTDVTALQSVLGAYSSFLNASNGKAKNVALLSMQQLESGITQAIWPVTVDPNKLGVIGFCFGGAMALNFARVGGYAKVAVSLHGEYPPLIGTTNSWNIDYFVEMIGDQDPMIQTAARDQWISELKSHATSGKNWEVQMFGKSMHAFSIRYSSQFYSTFASSYGATVLPSPEYGVSGFMKFEQIRAHESFDRIDDLFGRFGLLTTTTTTTQGTALIQKEHVYYADTTTGQACNVGASNCQMLVGWLIYQNTAGDPMRPGLLMFPGPYGGGGGQFERQKGEIYAKKGMVVFLPDYFPGNHSENDVTQVQTALSFYQPLLSDTVRAQALAKLALTQLTTQISPAIADATRIGVIGFCFGGAMALNLARSGATAKVVVSLHGEYPTMGNTYTPQWNVDYFVEIAGENDPFIASQNKNAWQAELRNRTLPSAAKNWDFLYYGNSVHAFSIFYSMSFYTALKAGNEYLMRNTGNADFNANQGYYGIGSSVSGPATKIMYERIRAEQSFDRIDDLFVTYGLISSLACVGCPTITGSTTTATIDSTTTTAESPAATTAAGRLQPTLLVAVMLVFFCPTEQ